MGSGPGVRPLQEQEGQGSSWAPTEDDGQGLPAGLRGALSASSSSASGPLQAGADGFIVLYVVILLGEKQILNLGVGPECVCGGSRSGWPCPSRGGWASRPRARPPQQGPVASDGPCPGPLGPVVQWVSGPSPIPCPEFHPSPSHSPPR